MHPSSACGAQPQGSCADWQVKYSENSLVTFGGQATSFGTPANCLQMNHQPHLQPFIGEHNKSFEFEMWVIFRSEAFWYFFSISCFAFKTQLVLCFARYSINYHKMKPVLTSVWLTAHSQWRIPQIWRLTCCWVC